MSGQDECTEASEHGSNSKPTCSEDMPTSSAKEGAPIVVPGPVHVYSRQPMMTFDDLILVKMLQRKARMLNR